MDSANSLNNSNIPNNQSRPDTDVQSAPIELERETGSRLTPPLEPRRQGPRQEARQAPRHEGAPPTDAVGLRALILASSERILADLARESDAQLEAYLGVMARFPRFSLFNHHLLFAQLPQASVLGEFDAWSAHGYQIKRGSRAIRLISGRAAISLFDIAQTRSRPGALALPTFRPEQQTPYAVYDKLTTHLLSIGAIDRQYLTDVQPESDPEAILEEIEYFARGYADYLLQQTVLPRIAPERINDCHVEAIAYVTLTHLGLASVFPGNDLEKWGKTVIALREELELVRRLALVMISELATYPSEETRGRRLRQTHSPLE